MELTSKITRGLKNIRRGLREYIVGFHFIYEKAVAYRGELAFQTI